MESDKVQVIESSLVAPREATPTKGLWLSPIDLAATAGHIPLVFFYSPGAAFSNVARLKEAMARALVAFYPLAGRLGVEEDGRLEISCNGEGALFVVSRCYLAAQDIDFSKPSPQLRRMFVPRIEPLSLILAVQCGRVVLGVAVHDSAVDGMSTFHFVQAWSAFAKDGDGAAIELPIHDRALLRARSPPVVHPDALSVLYPRVALCEPSGRPNAVEVFPISRDQLVTLKRLCGGASTFCSVSALVWQCAAVARRLPPDAVARLTFPVNIRRRGVRPPLPARYFGKALVELCTAGAAREIASEALASVACRVSRALARLDDDGELVRSAIDYLELFQTGSRPVRGSMLETELRVISWLNLPAYDADFGCGRPRWMSRAESVRGGFVIIMNDGSQEHDAVRVVMCMEAANINEFGLLLYASIANHASKL
ncbi:hydroxycinnamoyltransferase 4-like isoform X2 [Miscanthus floridulus]|uniref:hydroxycinnamoyltransferase 4-like isoform X2 n=1 Tax=Miscanthus floridulus TaxID=154761 RepID=UPI00345A72E9